MRSVPIEALQRVSLFSDLKKREIQEIARSFKEHHFAAGATIVKEGSGGVAFFVIKSGQAKVFVGGKRRATLKPGDYFGEIALIDRGSRLATVTAFSDLVCYCTTSWEFRPLVEGNGVIGWKLLQQMAKMLRATRGDLEQSG